MHETGMAYEILNIVSKTLDKHPGKRLLSVKVNIGQMAAVVPELLQSAYTSLIFQTPLDHSRLDIQIIPVQGNCLNCNKTFTLEEFVFACPYCLSQDLKVTHGDELHISSIEVE